MPDIADIARLSHTAKDGTMFCTALRSKVVYKLTFPPEGDIPPRSEGMLSGDLVRKDIGPEKGRVAHEKVHAYMKEDFLIPAEDNLEEWIVATLTNASFVARDPVEVIRHRIVS